MHEEHCMCTVEFTWLNTNLCVCILLESFNQSDRCHLVPCHFIGAQINSGDFSVSWLDLL